MSLSSGRLAERPIPADTSIQAERNACMHAAFTEMTIEGSAVKVRCAQIHDRPVVAMKGWVTIAKVMDEEWWDGEAVPLPEEFVATIRRNRTLGADIFTFGGTFAVPEPCFDFPFERESIAAVRTNSFADWWNNRVSSDLRKDVRKAAKRGVEVRCVPFTDDLVRGIKGDLRRKPYSAGKEILALQPGTRTGKSRECDISGAKHLSGSILRKRTGWVRKDRVRKSLSAFYADHRKGKRPR